MKDIGNTLKKLVIQIIEIIVSYGWMVVVAFAIFSLIVALFSSAYRAITLDREGPWFDDVNLSFVRGDIDDLGQVNNNAKNALYTKDMIECDEFRVTLKYGSDYYYEIHYFTLDDRWLSFETIKYTGTHSVLSLQMPDQTAGIRLVLVRNDDKNIGFFGKESAVKSIVLDVYRESEPTEAATDAAA